MKKYLLTILFMFSLLILSDNTFATVGGPTYISEIAYDKATNSIYYLENDNSGRGCPSIIHQVYINNGEDTEVKNCDEVFEEYFKSNDKESEERYRQFISDFYSNLSNPNIGSISLKRNNININVNVFSEYIENDEKYWTEFEAIVIQNEKKLIAFDFRGCDQEQPHIFEGYRIPNTNILAVLISNKGDCFEGGYVNETLHLVKGVTFYDEKLVRGYKGASATEPNLGNLIVYAPSENVLNEKTDDSVVEPLLNGNIDRNIMENNNLTCFSPLTLLMVFIVGLLLGYLIAIRAK